MGYKHIPAAIHNYASSFMSGMNLCNDLNYIYEKVLKCSLSQPVTVDFISGRVLGCDDNDINNYASRYSDRLNMHMKSEGCPLLSKFILRATDGSDVMAYAIDERGHDYQVVVE